MVEFAWMLGITYALIGVFVSIYTGIENNKSVPVSIGYGMVWLLLVLKGIKKACVEIYNS